LEFSHSRSMIIITGTGRHCRTALLDTIDVSYRRLVHDTSAEHCTNSKDILVLKRQLAAKLKTKFPSPGRFPGKHAGTGTGTAAPLFRIVICCRYRYMLAGKPRCPSINTGEGTGNGPSQKYSTGAGKASVQTTTSTSTATTS